MHARNSKLQLIIDATLFLMTQQEIQMAANNSATASRGFIGEGGGGRGGGGGGEGGRAGVQVVVFINCMVGKRSLSGRLLLTVLAPALTMATSVTCTSLQMASIWPNIPSEKRRRGWARVAAMGRVGLGLLL